MAVSLQTAADVLTRTTGLIPANSDYSCLFWVRTDDVNATPGNYKTLFIVNDAPYVGYAGIFIDSVTNTAYVAVEDGVSVVSTPTFTFLKHTYYAVAYVRSGNNHSFYVGGSLIGTVVLNISAITFAFEKIGYDGFAFSVPSIKVVGFREFNSALTAAQLITEWNSQVAILTAWCDTPLVSDGDDDSGNARNWTVGGSTTFVTGPIQIPQTNSTALTAYSVASLPAEFVQVPYNGATNINSWYILVAPAVADDPRVIGAWGFGGVLTTVNTYRPYTTPYDGPASAPVQLLGIGSHNVPIQFPVDGGNTYLVRIEPGTNNIPASLYVQIELFIPGTVTRGNILVPDDSTGFPLAIMSHSVDNTVVQFEKGFSASEMGDILFNSNIILMADSNNGNFQFYDLFFTRGSTAVNVTSGSSALRANQTLQKFYIGNIGSGPTHAAVRSITPAGVLGSVITLASAGLTGFCANNDETILYYSGAGGSLNSPIYRWDLVNNIALADFLPGVANSRTSDILILPDDSIIIPYENTSTNIITVKRYNVAGVLQNTYVLGANSGTISRFAYALDGSNSFWSWRHVLGMSIFENVQCSDGTILTTRNQTEYEVGTFQPSATDSPPSRFGNSYSCPFFIYPGSPISGLYFIDSTHASRHDIYNSDIVKKIPDPTIRTAFLGE